MIFQRKYLGKLFLLEVVLAVDCADICGADVHFWQEGRIASNVVMEPAVLGHEASGVCVDAVALICVDGLLQRYIQQDADMCYKLSDHLTMEEGALCALLAVGVAAVRRVKVGSNSKVLIVGSGPIGLATSIILLESMKCIPDKVIDCHGSQESFKLAIRSTAWGGTCCLVGMASGDFANFPFMDDMMREIKITSNFHHCNDYRTAIGVASQGKYDLLKMITHHFTMESASCAFDKAYK
uniref:Uncharacterized protein n=1 Tax=Glossina austeni TaxID=7395 RepID=A0A1A9VGV7_GLOAU